MWYQWEYNIVGVSFLFLAKIIVKNSFLIPRTYLMGITLHFRSQVLVLFGLFNKQICIGGTSIDFTHIRLSRLLFSFIPFMNGTDVNK